MVDPHHATGRDTGDAGTPTEPTMAYVGRTTHPTASNMLLSRIYRDNAAGEISSDPDDTE